MKRTNLFFIPGASLLLVFALCTVALATDATMYFSTDKNGENRVTSIKEGEQVWLCVYDPDEDIACDVRDKVWTDVKVMDAKTGAHIVWKSYKDKDGADTDGNGTGDKLFEDDGYVPHKGHFPGPTAGWTGADFLEETDASTGLFVSARPFMIGTRASFSAGPQDGAHIAGPYQGASPGPVTPTDFEWGGYLYADSTDDGSGDDRVWVDPYGNFVLATPPGPATPPGNAYLPGDTGSSTAKASEDYVFGRFSNLDTLVALYVDQNDPGDVALAQAKLTDTRSTLSWDQEVYSDGREAATITVTDPDENLNCDAAEFVPVFVIVNPGSWNPVVKNSANDFCSLKRYGGVMDDGGTIKVGPGPLEWYTLYDSQQFIPLGSNQPNVQGTYYIEYPTEDEDNVTWFDTASVTGITRVMFYAQETGANTGVFEFSINHILRDLGFKSLRVGDVLAAFYVDPNDQDDVSLGMATIGQRAHSITQFTDAARNERDEFAIGHTPVYVQVIDENANTDACCPEQVVVHICDPHEVDDVEWLILDELSSNSAIFFSNLGLLLGSTWNAAGLSDIGGNGGYQLQMDNWRIEGFNEDTVYARYNDVVYTDAAMAQIGDSDTRTAFPPTIRNVRLANDVSFATMHISDTQVVSPDGEVTMTFLDRQGNALTEYANSDCVFIQVIDPDQDEDHNRRERIAGYWDGAQNLPFAPWNYPENHAACGYEDVKTHPVNDLLGDTNIFSSATSEQWPKLYVLNPRNGRFAAFDLLETGVATGTFVSVTCIDLVSQYDCVPALGVLPGDTILATYQDPSNHSDNAWISIKVAIGGAAAVQRSTTAFVDASGAEVDAYAIGEPIYVEVIDRSMAGAGVLPGAVTVDGIAADLSPVPGAEPGTFMTAALDIDCTEGQTLTATYTDPSDPGDTSSDTVTITSTELTVERFYAGPNPFADSVDFSYVGTGIAAQLSVTVYDLSGHRVWQADEEHALRIVWDGRDEHGARLANGAYIYVITASKDDQVFTGKEKVFIRR